MLVWMSRARLISTKADAVVVPGDFLEDAEGAFEGLNAAAALAVPARGVRLFAHLESPSGGGVAQCCHGYKRVNSHNVGILYATVRSLQDPGLHLLSIGTKHAAR
ncbi:MAG: hypothetical protein M5U09_03980 [Gammaproteobacteria bacterium]|nr:hypothetical protein [Gammaproteobacteria bacterium]